MNSEHNGFGFSWHKDGNYKTDKINIKVDILENSIHSTATVALDLIPFLIPNFLNKFGVGFVLEQSDGNKNLDY